MVVVYCGEGVLVSLLTCTHFAGETVCMSKKIYLVCKNRGHQFESAGKTKDARNSAATEFNLW